MPAHAHDGRTVTHARTHARAHSLVKALSAQGVRVRVLGVMHSWSNVFAEDGTHVVFLDNFKAIVQDPNDYTVVTLQVSDHSLRWGDLHLRSLACLRLPRPSPARHRAASLRLSPFFPRRPFSVHVVPSLTASLLPPPSDTHRPA